MKEVIGIGLMVFGGLVLYPEVVNLVHLHDVADSGFFGAWFAAATGYARDPDVIKILLGGIVAGFGAYLFFGGKN